MKIKKYVQFLAEAVDSVKDGPTFDGIKDSIRGMIEETLKNSKKKKNKKEKSGGTDIKTFASKYVQDNENTSKNSSGVSIEGLINDDQIYDFWLEFENEIDELLNQIGFYNESPAENNALGTYKYIIEATKKAILEIVRLLK
jgi:hypothetical protein